jgi:hypothetical protein
VLACPLSIAVIRSAAPAPAFAAPLGLLITFSNAVYAPLGIALAAAVASWIYKWVIASGEPVQTV